MRNLLCFFLLIVNLPPSLAYSRLNDPVIREKPQSIHTHAARILLEKNQTELALNELKRALHAQPGDRRISVRLAEMYVKNKEPLKALDLLYPLQTVSTKKTNIYYYIGLILDSLEKYSDAYIYYQKAFKLDPTLYKAKLKIAQIFIKKGLYFDAATHLKNLLEINNDYKQARLEFESVLKIIKENKNNIFRRGNMVITFPDYNLIRDIEEWYPFLQEKVYYLQNALNLEREVIYVQIVTKMKNNAQPPAFYNALENKIYLTVDTVQRKYTALFTHELAYMYFHQIGISKSPKWLQEGLALYFSQPNILANMSMRRLNCNWDIINHRFYADKRYLNFDKLGKKDRENLFQAFMIAKFLIQRYGWDNVEKFVKAFEPGRVKVSQAVWETFHIEYQRLVDEFDLYMITNHFFKG